MTRTSMAVGVGAVLALAACERQPGIVAAPTQAPPRFNVPFITSGLGEQDTTGTPDLAVDAAKLASSWVISVEDITPDNCAVIEGDVTPGVHRLLRFTVSVPNIGDADLFIGDPRAHVDPNGDGDPSDSDGLFEFGNCHGHFHFRNYARYELLPIRPDGSLGPTLRSRKAGFCMIDETPFNTGDPPKNRVYYACGNFSYPGRQGISTGYSDVYSKDLQGQYFVLDDPAEPVTPGEYLLRIYVNPAFAPVGGEPCPVLDPATGLCHNFAEASYENNVGQVRIVVPAERPGKTGTPIKTAQDFADDENRPAN